ncbi:MAG: 30S ribosomal protein S17 [Candidatus Woesebacteria bacterium]|nr:30S ribosomal protein S17 [Candidatus Woesebacteria bacterium]
MKIFIGRVVATKTAKTATVAVERMTIHPLYKKRLKRIRKYQVHDEMGVKVGDNVKFSDCRPYSKTKKWKITGLVIEKKGKK